LNDKVLGEGFSNFDEADIKKILHFHNAELIEENLQQITALSELQYERRI
jgi:restriction endonuclease Mrr